MLKTPARTTRNPRKSIIRKTSNANTTVELHLALSQNIHCQFVTDLNNKPNKHNSSLNQNRCIWG